MKRITFSKGALRTPSRLPTKTAKLIRSEVDQYAADPTSQTNNVKTLKSGDSAFRLRMGDWRVIFNESDEVIAVIKVAARGGTNDRRIEP